LCARVIYSQDWSMSEGVNVNEGGRGRGQAVAGTRDFNARQVVFCERALG